VIDIGKILDVVIDQKDHNEPLELTDEQKHIVDKSRRLRGYYASIIKDIGKLMKDLDSKKPKKKDYIDNMMMASVSSELEKKMK